MAQICPRCGGTEIGCPVCGLPPRHAKPKVGLMAMMRTALFALPQAQTWEVQGVDVSAWNGVMDFSITKTKCQFAIVRLGYGNGWKDYRSDQYRKDLIANDMPYGVYWYCKPGQDPIAHAENFAEVASEFPFQLGFEEDYETTTLTPAGTLDWIIRLDTKAKELIKRMTSAYSSAGFWNEKVAPNNYFTDEQWVANWTSAPVPYMPKNWTWKKGCKWQWSADGNRKAKEYGMVKDGDYDMDLNRYYGTCAEFNTRYGTHFTPIRIVLPDYFIVDIANLNIRSEPNPSSDIYVIGTTKYNKKWKPIDLVIGTDGNEWWKINEYAYVAKWLTKLG